MSSLAIYLIGLVIFIAGLVYGAHLLHVPEKYWGWLSGVAWAGRLDGSDQNPPTRFFG